MKHYKSVTDLGPLCCIYRANGSTRGRDKPCVHCGRKREDAIHSERMRRAVRSYHAVVDQLRRAHLDAFVASNEVVLERLERRIQAVLHSMAKCGHAGMYQQLNERLQEAKELKGGLVLWREDRDVVAAMDKLRLDSKTRKP